MDSRYFGVKLPELGNGWNMGLRERRGQRSRRNWRSEPNLPAAPVSTTPFPFPFSQSSAKLLLGAAVSGNRLKTQHCRMGLRKKPLGLVLGPPLTPLGSLSLIFPSGQE